MVLWLLLLIHFIIITVLLAFTIKLNQLLWAKCLWKWVYYGYFCFNVSKVSLSFIKALLKNQYTIIARLYNPDIRSLLLRLRWRRIMLPIYFRHYCLIVLLVNVSLITLFIKWKTWPLLAVVFTHFAYTLLLKSSLLRIFMY